MSQIEYIIELKEAGIPKRAPKMVIGLRAMSYDYY